MAETETRREKKERHRSSSSMERRLIDSIRRGQPVEELFAMEVSDIARPVPPSNGTYFHRALDCYAKQPSEGGQEIIQRFICVLRDSVWPPELLQADKNGKNFLHFAATTSNPDILTSVMELVQEPEVFLRLLQTQETAEQRTPLHYIFRFRFPISIIKTIRKRVGKRAFEQLLQVQDNKGMSPFHVCVFRHTPDAIRAMLALLRDKAPAYIMLNTQDNRTALHIIAKRNCGLLLEMSKLLGPNLPETVKMKSKDGWSVLHVVTKYQEDDNSALQFFELLPDDVLATLAVEVDFTGVSPFHLAVCFLPEEAIMYLVKVMGVDRVLEAMEQKDVEGHTVFQSAVIYQDWSAIEHICDLVPADRRKAFLLSQDNQGMTPLHLAMHREDPDPGEDPNEVGTHRKTALVADRLLTLYAEEAPEIMKMKTRNMCTILHEAAHFQPPYIVRKVSALLGDRLAAELQETDAEGYTPLHVAAHHQPPDIVEFFVEALPVEELSHCIRAPECDGWTMLHYAAKHQTVDLLHYIVDKIPKEAADALTQEDNFRATPFHLASKYRTAQCVLYLMQVIGPEKLPAILSRQRHDGNTPLHLAAKFQNTEVVEKMIQGLDTRAGKVIAMVNRNNRNVLHMSTLPKNPDTLRVLFKAVPNSAKDLVLAEDVGQMTVLHLIVKRLGTDMLKEVLEMFQNSGDNLLYLSLSKPVCSMSVISILIRIYGADAHEQINQMIDGQSPLHLAAGYHSQAIIGLLLTALDGSSRSTVWNTPNKKDLTCNQLCKKNKTLKGNRSWEIYFALRFEPALTPRMTGLNNIQALDMSFLPFNKNLVESFLNFAHSMRSLKRLTWKKCSITDNLLQMLLPWLTFQQNLEVINLAENMISNIAALFETLDKLSGTLRTVHVQRNYLFFTQTQFFKLVTSRMRNSNIQSFDIGSNFLFTEPSKRSVLCPRPPPEDGPIPTPPIYEHQFFVSKEETVASLLNPLHGTDTRHWHVMLCCKPRRQRVKLFVEGMQENGQRVLYYIRVPHFSKVVRNLRAITRLRSPVAVNLNKYRRQSWAISPKQADFLLAQANQDIRGLDSDTSRGILSWGLALLSEIDIEVDMSSFEDASKSSKCLVFHVSPENIYSAIGGDILSHNMQTRLLWVVGVFCVVLCSWLLSTTNKPESAVKPEPSFSPCSVEQLQHFHPARATPHSQVGSPHSMKTRREKAQTQNHHLRDFHVVVVGGGIVGLSHALEAWESGIGHVSLVEKRANYTRDVWFDLYGAPWFSSLEKLRSWGLYDVDLDLINHDERAISVRAQMMERHLSRVAYEVGLQMFYDVSFLGLEEDHSKPSRVILEKVQTKETIQLPYDVLVAADGSRSAIRSYTGVEYRPIPRVVVDQEMISVPDGCSQLAVIMRFRPDVNGSCPAEARDPTTGEKILPWDIGLQLPTSGVSQVYKRFFSNYCELQIFFNYEQGTRLGQMHQEGDEDWPLLLAIVNQALEIPYPSVENLQQALLPGKEKDSLYHHHVNVTIRQAAQAVWPSPFPEMSSVVVFVGDAAVTSHFRLGIGINSMYDQLNVFRRFLLPLGSSPFASLVEEYQRAIQIRHSQVARFEVLSILYEAFCDWLVFIDPEEEQSALDGMVVFGKDWELGDYLLEPFPPSQLFSHCPFLGTLKN